MDKCKLCLVNDADKKGSHIVPHFLMKRIDNNNSKTREKELGFNIGKLETKSYFGRGLSVEKLEEVYGEVNDELIENNNIDLVVDYYFCKSCEDNLAKIESEYSKSINVFSEFEKNYESTKIKSIGFLFWTSIIWRLSIKENSGFKLKIKEENRLRRILNNYFVDNNLSQQSYDFNSIGYIILRSPNYPNDLPTYLHWEPTYTRPYSIIINEYIIFYYFKSTYLNGMILDFYDTEKFKSIAHFNSPFENEIILKISQEKLKEINEKINLRLVFDRLKEYDYILNELHRKLGGKGEMDINIRNKIKHNIVTSDLPIGKKDSLENIKKIIADTMIEIYKPSH